MTTIGVFITACFTSILRNIFKRIIKTKGGATDENKDTSDSPRQIIRALYEVLGMNFFVTGAVFLFAALLARDFWCNVQSQLNAMAGDTALLAAISSIKPAINLIMYIVPSTFGCLGFAFAIIGGVQMLVDDIAAIADICWQDIQQRRQARREGKCQKD